MTTPDIFQMYLKKNTLFILVFITGAAVLIVEVAAMRILSPFFGNTIYTVSGVIGVILAALSMGYAHGGRYADKIPTRHEFFRVIEKSGLALLILFLLMSTILPSLARLFPLSWGPLLWAFILFFAPSYFLGMLSPFAIKLAIGEHPELGTGTISGKVFFWSTCGSIVGTLLTAFVFIPYFGLNSIIFGTTFIILLIGGVGKIISEDQEKRRKHIFILIVFLFLCLFLFAATRTPPSVLFSKDGVYEHLTIIDTEDAGRPARFFYQDRSDSGEIFLDGNDLAVPYTKYYALHKLFKPSVTRALFIGGGIYSMPVALHRDLPNAQIDIAEIEPSLFGLAQKYFNVPNDPNLINYTEDGRRFLEESTTTYDMIFSDVYYSYYSIPPHFTTREFFSAARKKLTPNGIFIVNLIGSLLPDKPSFILSEIRTIQSVFPEIYVFAVDSPNIPNPQNIVVVGINRNLENSIQPNWALNFDPLPKDLASHIIPMERYNLNDYPILTDDYAPVEYMISGVIGRDYSRVSGTPNALLWSGERALRDIATQLSFGPRSLGTAGHEKEISFIKNELAKTSAVIEIQYGTYLGSDEMSHPLTNIIGRLNPSNPNRIIVGTHYDSIVRAYRDVQNTNAPMPGANNSASGVALLLETARVLDSLKQQPEVGIDLVFFDGEEGAQSLGAGDPNWVPLGSPYFATHLTDLYPKQKPKKGIVFDMVCDKNLGIHPESSSLDSVRSEINKFWDIGRVVAPSAFLKDSQKTPISDDQTALLAAGVPSFLVIDFTYEPWFNTTQDTIDKCSTTSMEAVGRTLLQYLYTY